MERSQIQVVTSAVCEQVQQLLGDKLTKLLLYGSYARMDFTAESDMDVMALVELSDEELDAYRVPLSKIASRIGLQYDIMISLSIMPACVVYNNADVVPFYRNILREGVDLIA